MQLETAPIRGIDMSDTDATRQRRSAAQRRRRLREAFLDLYWRERTIAAFYEQLAHEQRLIIKQREIDSQFAGRE
jgi:hypothetical protein